MKNNQSYVLFLRMVFAIFAIFASACIETNPTDQKTLPFQTASWFDKARPDLLAPPPSPVIEAMQPDRGTIEGSTEVLILGQNLEGDTIEVHFSGLDALEIKGYGPQIIMATTPPGVREELVDVSVTIDGQTVTMEKYFRYLSNIETEPNNTKGINDQVESAQEIPLNADFSAYIGALDDLDYFQFNPPDDGVVWLELDFSASFWEYNLCSMMAIFYQGSADFWNFSGLALSSFTNNERGIDGFERSVYVDDEPCFVQISSPMCFDESGMPVALGWDTENPYTIRLNFHSGPGMEAGQLPVENIPVEPADNWMRAMEVVFDQGSDGIAYLPSYLWYDLDFDWYKFTADKDGWLRVTLDVLGFGPDTSDPAMSIYGSLLTNQPSWEIVGSSVNVGDPPNRPVSVTEWQGIKAGQTYFLRLYGFAFKEVPYRLWLEHRPGGIEDLEPSDAPRSDDPSNCYDLGTVAADGTASSHQAYMFHDRDWDWYSFKTPAGGDGMLCLRWDFTNTYQSKGWYQYAVNPYGIEYWMDLYPAIWDQWTDRLALADEEDVPAQIISFGATADTEYKVMLRALEGFDPERAYTFSAAFFPGAESCP